MQEHLDAQTAGHKATSSPITLHGVATPIPTHSCLFSRSQGGGGVLLKAIPTQPGPQPSIPSLPFPDRPVPSTPAVSTAPSAPQPVNTRIPLQDEVASLASAASCHPHHPPLAHRARLTAEAALSKTRPPVDSRPDDQLFRYSLALWGHHTSRHCTVSPSATPPATPTQLGAPALWLGPLPSSRSPLSLENVTNYKLMTLINIHLSPIWPNAHGHLRRRPRDVR